MTRNAGLALVLLSLLFEGGMVMADQPPRLLFDFTTAEAARNWLTVNDGVMGGMSVGTFRWTDRQTLEFSGTLSLENNGGFASVRCRPSRLNLQTGDTLLIRLRGDGREYSVNLYVPRPQVAFSYRAVVPTKKDEWQEVRLPLDKFQATSFGRVVPGAGPVDPAEVTALGFLLGDKKPGPFRLEVASIRVQSAEPRK
jgi:NADH dehydrogenase [ubiquinone] 1 alpha subcomplex assembly factor 1